MLELKNLSKVFDNGVERITAVKPTNLKINDGEFVIIVGGNGTGKSTLLNLICGDVKQTTGQIFIDNNNVTNLLRQDRAKYISYIFQDPSASVCPDMTIAENFAIANARVKNRGLKFGITKKDIILFKERLAEFNLDLEKRLNQKVSLLSGGHKLSHF